MAADEVDLAKLQSEYAFMEKTFNQWSSDVEEVMNRADRIAAADAAFKDPGLGAYHQRTLALLDKTLDRIKQLHEQMVQAGVEKLKP